MVSPYRFHFFFLLISLETIEGINTVKYTVTIAGNADTTKGAFLFKNTIGVDDAKQHMMLATHFIWFIFGQYSPHERKPVKKISLLVEKRYRNLVQDNEIRLSTRYIENFSGNVTQEIIGLLYRELTWILQWNGEEKIPPGLKTGIADFVRLKAGYEKREWVKPGEGDRWDQGNDVTARFLQYCINLSPGFVAKLNKRMEFDYSDNYFEDLTGKTVDELWRDYKIKHDE